MTVDYLLKAIAEVGFPVVVSIYLLVVIGNKLDRLSDAVDKLAMYVKGLGNRE